jgi:hypothetical protein
MSALGQSRHFALRKDKEPFRGPPGRNGVPFRLLHC